MWHPERARGRLLAIFTWITLGLAISTIEVLFSWAIATFPGERQEELMPRTAISLHNWMFNSPVDNTSRHRWLPFSSTLVLSGFNILEGLGIDDPEKAKWRDFIFRARGRDLEGARFDFASLPRVDFSGADLEGASLDDAQLDRVSLDGAQLCRASLIGAQLQGASLNGAQLQGTRLQSARLWGASLFPL